MGIRLLYSRQYLCGPLFCVVFTWKHQYDIHNDDHWPFSVFVGHFWDMTKVNDYLIINFDAQPVFVDYRFKFVKFIFD